MTDKEQPFSQPEFTVAKTKDEFGNDRFFVQDQDGEWVGPAYDTADQAFGAIDQLKSA
jgi:hypothetical protein